MFSIPEEKLPECFKNDLRLNVLYAPLRSKSVNPSDWNSKITSWSQLINIYSSCNKVYKFSLDSLRIAFHQNGRSPSCLKEVIQEMVKSGDIELLDIFLQEKPKSWKEWATNVLISSPISWSLNKMKSMVTNLDNTTLYVPVKILEQEGDFY
ncbi:hypothetical protein HHI36_016234 [Cryptolaemus montrouzieri]|uniref:Uncharacterized protein n=1 Tax=Cryptolaemus montrouzieri TaxID=559131 RepID=A0ABD2NJ16_9CUCU